MKMKVDDNVGEDEKLRRTMMKSKEKEKRK